MEKLDQKWVKWLKEIKIEKKDLKYYEKNNPKETLSIGWVVLWVQCLIPLVLGLVLLIRLIFPLFLLFFSLEYVYTVCIVSGVVLLMSLYFVFYSYYYKKVEIKRKHDKERQKLEKQDKLDFNFSLGFITKQALAELEIDISHNKMWRDTLLLFCILFTSNVLIVSLYFYLFYLCRFFRVELAGIIIVLLWLKFPVIRLIIKIQKLQWKLFMKLWT